VTSYSGKAMLRGSKVMGMHNDLACGTPTWQTMWVTS
jgi:hypothetical protein